MAENKGTKPGNAPKQEQDPKSPGPVTPQITMRGNKAMQHHLFESDVANCKKNVSYTPGQPDLKLMPHKHFFHNIDSRGRKLTISSISNNHFHDMTWWIDPTTGKMMAKSGPPLKQVTKRYKSGLTELVNETISWTDEKDHVEKDDHVHTWEYVDSEEFTANGLEARRQANRNEVGSVHVKPMQNVAAFNAADPVSLVEAPETLKRT